MKTYTAKRTRQRIFILIASAFTMVQYQNCAGPVNQSSASNDPNYTAAPIVGSVSNATVSESGNSSKMLFAMSSVELSSGSSSLRPGGVCSLPANGEEIQWQLSRDGIDSQVILQGTEECIHGSFYVDLNSQLSNLECDKSYSLSASLTGEGTAQMSIIKHCNSGVASN